MRLEAELEKKNVELEKEKANLGAEIGRLSDLEAVSELRDQAKDQQLQAKDATIQELRTALDNAGRSPIPAIVKAPVNVSDGQKDPKSASKAAQPTSHFGSTLSKTSFDSAGKLFVPQPSKTTAEVANAPSQFGHSMTREESDHLPFGRPTDDETFDLDLPCQSLFDRFKRKRLEAEAAIESKVPEKKRKRDTIGG